MNFQFRKNSQVARPCPKKGQNKNVQNKNAQNKKVHAKNVNSAKKENHIEYVDQLYDHGNSEHVERIVPHKHDATYTSKIKQTNINADHYGLNINVGKSGLTKYCVDGIYTFDTCTKEGYHKKAHHAHIISNKKCKNFDSTKEITDGGKVDLTIGGTFDVSSQYDVLKDNVIIHKKLEKTVTLYGDAEHSSVIRRVEKDGTVVESWSLKPIEVLGNDKNPHTIFAYVKDQ